VPRHFLALLTVVSLLGVSPRAAVAQSTPSDDPAGRALIHFGPLALQPRLTVRNIGIDTNVFNAATGRERDFTATFVPGIDSWLRLGRTQLTGRTTAEMVYFSRHASERSAAIGQDLRLDVNLRRLTPFVSVSRTNSFTRPSLEFDQRIRRIADAGTAGVIVRLTRAMTFEVEGRQGRVKFGDADDDQPVADALDHRSQQVTLTGRIALTRMTTFVAAYEDRRDRFTRSSLRDTNVAGLLSGLEFRPRGLLAGRAVAGFRRLVPLRDDVPEFVGLAASADVRYTWREATQLTLRVKRDVDYSFEPDSPYFVETGIGISVTQLVVGMWDAVGQVSLDRLAYRAVTGGAAAARVDRIRTLTAGIGYHLGFAARVGVEITAQRRASAVSHRNFDGLRFGGVFTYGY
jgi:hypothetical protein